MLIITASHQTFSSQFWCLTGQNKFDLTHLLYIINGKVSVFLEDKAMSGQISTLIISTAERDVAHQMSREKRKPSRESRPPPPPPNVFPQWVPAVPQTQQMFLPQQAPPRHQGIYKPPGPCFNCFQMGHIKANCPRQTRPQYPLSSNNNIQLTVWGVR